MKLLLIEDERHFAEALTAEMQQRIDSIEIELVRSRDGAFRVIERGLDADLVICDLRIPARDGELGVAEEHGFAVHQRLRDRYPGVPTMFLTGYARLEVMKDRLAIAQPQDAFGAGPYPMVQLFVKDQPDQFLGALAAVAADLKNLAQVQLTLDPDLALGELERRALRILTRRLSATSAHAAPLGGLSGARTLRVTLQGQRGNAIGSLFAKIALYGEILDERERYRQFVSARVPFPGAPSLVEEVWAGMGSRAAVFYQLADDYQSSLFQALSSGLPGTQAIQKLRGLVRNWANLVEERAVLVRSLRSARLPHDVFERFSDRLDCRWELFEEAEQRSAFACQHGDLHGLNVLCREDGEVCIIDYGDVGIAPSALDPVTLEMSLYFHRESPFRSSGWPTPEQGRDWINVDAFIQGCPVPEFVRACRAWATQVARDQVDLAMIGYCHALRQIKYPDTDKALALAIASSACEGGLAALKH